MPLLLAGGVCCVAAFVGAGAGLAAGALAGAAVAPGGVEAAGALEADAGGDFLDLVDLAVDESLVLAEESAVADLPDLEVFFEVPASAAAVPESDVSAFLDLEDFLAEEVSAEAEESAVSDFWDLEDFFAEELSAVAWSVEAVDFFFEEDFEEVEESLADESSVVFFFLDFDVVVSVWS